MSRTFRACVRCSGLLLLALSLSGCNMFPTLDLSPAYQPPEYVVPASWHGSSPFVEAKPSDGELRQDWWKLFNDPILNKLEEQAMAANPDLQAAAERFVQARDVMMKARSQYIRSRKVVRMEALEGPRSRQRLFADDPPDVQHGTR